MTVAVGSGVGDSVGVGLAVAVGSGLGVQKLPPPPQAPKVPIAPRAQTEMTIAKMALTLRLRIMEPLYKCGVPSGTLIGSLMEALTPAILSQA